MRGISSGEKGVPSHPLGMKGENYVFLFAVRRPR